MKPTIKKELARIFDLKDVDFSTTARGSAGLVPIFKKDSEIVAYDAKHRKVVFIGKSEKSFSIDDLRQIVSIAETKE